MQQKERIAFTQHWPLHAWLVPATVLGQGWHAQENWRVLCYWYCPYWSSTSYPPPPHTLPVWASRSPKKSKFLPHYFSVLTVCKSVCQKVFICRPAKINECFIHIFLFTFPKLGQESPGVIVHTCNPSSRMVSSSQPRIYSEALSQKTKKGKLHLSTSWTPPGFSELLCSINGTFRG
jgi:hypothetical protein